MSLDAKTKFLYMRADEESRLPRSELVQMYLSTMHAANTVRSLSLSEQYRKAAEQLRGWHQLTAEEIAAQEQSCTT